MRLYVRVSSACALAYLVVILAAAMTTSLSNAVVVSAFSTDAVGAFRSYGPTGNAGPLPRSVSLLTTTCKTKTILTPRRNSAALRRMSAGPDRHDRRRRGNDDGDGGHRHRFSTPPLPFRMGQCLARNDVVASSGGMSGPLFADTTAADGNEPSSSSTGGGDQTLTQASFNLIKVCLGSVVFALPAGVAAVGDVPLALAPASALLAFMAALSAYSFSMLGRLAKNVGQGSSPKSFGEAWEKEFGPGSSGVVVLSCLLTPFGTALAYLIMLGDLFSSVAQSAGLKGILATRHFSILAVTTSYIYPLCNLKSLASLAPLSIAGVVGIVLTCAFMALRLMTGAYLPGGAYFDAITPALRPSFGSIGLSNVLSPSALVLAGMAATAYLVHYSEYDFYDGLENNTVKRFGWLSSIGFGATCLINVFVMSLGFLTFGGSSAGVILNNYSARDIGATICRIVVAISLIGSYPIFFRGIKSAFIDLFYKGKDVTDEVGKSLTRMLLAALTGAALVLENAGFMVSFVGAVMGSAIIYIFPPLMYLKSTARRIEAGTIKKSKRVKAERALCRLLIGLGAIMGVVGGTVTVLDAFFPHLL